VPGPANPPTGIFQGILNGSAGSPGCGSVHNEGEGYFRVTVISNGRRMVPVGNSSYCSGIVVSKILAPSDFKVAINPTTAKAFVRLHSPDGQKSATYHVRLARTGDGWQVSSASGTAIGVH
jgi:hypothetical protein